MPGWCSSLLPKFSLVVMGPGSRLGRRFAPTYWLGRDDKENIRSLRVGRPSCDKFGPRLAVIRAPNESAYAGKPLAPDACRQCRRSLRGFSLQDPATTLCPLHPPFGRLSFRLHQARPDRRVGVAVHLQSAGVAGIRALGYRMAHHGRSFHKAVPANFWLRRRASAAVRVHGGLAVLPEEFHVHAGAF